MATRKFSVGDRARINYPSSTLHGRECTIVSNGLVPPVAGPASYVGYRIDLFCTCGCGVQCTFEPHELIPIYDGNEKVSWSECAWKPKELVHGN